MRRAARRVIYRASECTPHCVGSQTPKWWTCRQSHTPAPLVPAGGGRQTTCERAARKFHRICQRKRYHDPLRFELRDLRSSRQCSRLTNAREIALQPEVVHDWRWDMKYMKSQLFSMGVTGANPSGSIS